MEITNFFQWFFTAIKSIVYLLNDKLVITLSGYKVSFWSILLTFFIINILISAFIKAGGVKND